MIARAYLKLGNVQKCLENLNSLEPDYLNFKQQMMRDALIASCCLKNSVKEGTESMIKFLKQLKSSQSFKFRKLAEIGKGNEISVQENCKELSFVDFLLSQNKVTQARVEKIVSLINFFKQGLSNHPS